MYAVIETGGKQLKVSEGETVLVEKLDGEVGSDFVFDKVMAIVDGDNTKIGTPYVDGAKVSATIVKQDKSKKVIVFKYRSKTNYRKKTGHRQPYTKVTIKSIQL